jgi:DNA-binding XRE family transcriptional regulator
MRSSKKPDDAALEKEQLREAIEHGEISIGEAVRRMRKISGMSQKAYAQKIVGVSPRVLAEIELDTANPTVETLNKIGRPFGYKVGFVHK